MNLTTVTPNMICFILVWSLAAAVTPVAAGRERSSLAIPRRKGGARAPICGSIRLLTGFGDPRFFTDKYIPADKPGVALKLPNYDVLFDEISKVSPLARQALSESNPLGIKAINNTSDVYKWKVMADSSCRLVSHIDKIDNFQKKGVPLVRFRSTLHGPVKKRAECFSELISVANLRHKWDPTSDLVETVYSADVKEVDKFLGNKYGETSMFGIGYVKSKQSVVSPREQLTLCGLQIFPSGASILWGIELEEDQNHLFPKVQTKRQPRSTSHLFSTTIIPTGNDTFDVEYVLQIEIGGFPGWLTGPIVIETVKKMFSFADEYFKGGLEGGALAKRLSLIADEETPPSPFFFATPRVSDHNESSESSGHAVLDKEQTLLMTP
ncbi:hypothetical protein ACHAW5_009574 [Stephanodiscus triporus]|uniref:START domain-containing protein n=1 Tax=Stephanodiscus triporus TaxID=2934178 RepID=A0ABD3NEV4_9STRA